MTVDHRIYLRPGVDLVTAEDACAADPALADVPRHAPGVPYGPRRKPLATTPAPGDESAS